MTDFENFCHEYLQKYMDDFINPKIRLTEMYNFLYMKSNEFKDDRIIQVLRNEESKYHISKIINQHNPDMFLVIILSKINDDALEKEEFVIATGRTRNEKEKMIKAFSIDGNKKLLLMKPLDENILKNYQSFT